MARLIVNNVSLEQFLAADALVLGGTSSPSAWSTSSGSG